MDAYHVLVIVLSVLLAIFLVVSILIAIYIYKFVKTVNELTDKALDVVDSAVTIRKFVSPAVVGRFIFESVQKVLKSNEEDEDKETKNGK